LPHSPKEVRGHDRAKRCLKQIDSLLTLHTPDVLVLQNTTRRGTRRAPRIQALNYQALLLAKRRRHSVPYLFALPRAWLARQPLPDDERAAVERHVRELDRLAEDLAVLDREIAQAAIDDPAVRRLITITGVNLTVATGIVAAIGDISRFRSPQKLVSYFGLNPRVRQSGLGVAHHGRISKIGRSHARAMLVEAAWAAAKAPGPLHAFFVRIRAKRGHQIAAVAVARKLTVLCWHLLTRGEDYLWARPALVANKARAMELQAGHPQQKGSRRGPAYAYNVKTLRDQEILVAAQAERSYERFVAQWKPRRPKEPARGRLKSAGHQ
jgi:transposase